MKQKDLALLIVVVAISVVISVFLSKLIFKSPTGSSEQVDVVPILSANFPTPNPAYFNPQAIDPTQLITIGDSNNTAPFTTANQ
jgi:hypothetical protein